MTGPVRLTESDWLLARAVTARPDEAGTAWRNWSAANQVDALSDHAYPFLVALGARSDAEPPGDEAGRLRGLHRRSWYVNQRLAAAAHRASGTLDAIGVRAAMFGGVALAVVDEHSGRHCSGVDLLLQPAFLEPATVHLEAHGARIVSVGTRRPSSVIVLVDGEGQHLRLHTQLPHVGALGRRAEGVWSRCSSVSMAGHDIVTLSAADSLALAAAPRLGWHEGDDAVWPVDVHRLVATNGTDDWWSTVVEAAADTPWGADVAAALRECRARLGTPVPDCVLARLAVLDGPGVGLRLERVARTARSRLRRRPAVAPAPARLPDDV